MKSLDEVKRDLFEKWTRRADEDLAVAEQLLSDGVPYFGTIGFHAQQSAEKCLKSFLVWHQIEFPKTHDLGKLLELVALSDKKLADSLESIMVLTDYCVDTRYPADLPELSASEASTAIDLAQQTKDAVLASLANSRGSTETK